MLSSTENVAMARTAEGTELVRVGRVERHELAGWRYGDRFTRRWRRQRWYAPAGWGAGFSMAIATSLPLWPLVVATGAYAAYYHGRPVARTGDGTLIRHGRAQNALLLPEASAARGWSLVLPRRSLLPPWREDEANALVVEGDDALRVLRAALPRMNWDGGEVADVWEAVGELDRLGPTDRVLRGAALSLEHPAGMDPRWPRAYQARPHGIFGARAGIRLALEMAVNEETERRALEGELAVLERGWKEAEELAAISDDLLLPAAVREKLLEWKRRGRSGTGP